MIFISPEDTLKEIAHKLKEQRLIANLTQAELSGRSNIPLPTLRKFEATGKISLESFIKLAFVMGLHERILDVVKPSNKQATSMDELLKEDKPIRQRASSKRIRYDH